jgi:DNA processing protein
MAMESSADRVAALGLWCVPGITRASMRGLIQDHGSIGAAADAFPEARQLGEQALEATRAFGAEVLLPGDPQWPVELDRVHAPPGALFVWGELPPLPGVAIVGSRHATVNGLAFARDLARDLASRGHTVVSGGALGVDGAAHAGALASLSSQDSSKTGKTLAILGSGLGELYPPQHVPLFRRIADGGGAVVTEFPFSSLAFPHQFPRRNRLIAALGRAVVVVEAAPRSGSLITAREARKLGRAILAVPGTPGQAVSEGTNALLKQPGVSLCTGVDDVLLALESMPAVAPPVEPLAISPPRAPRKRAQRVPAVATGDAELDRFGALLGLSPRSLDEIAEAARATPAEAAAAVSRLELLGLACRAAGGQVYRPREGQENA